MTPLAMSVVFLGYDRPTDAKWRAVEWRYCAVFELK